MLSYSAQAVPPRHVNLIPCLVLQNLNTGLVLTEIVPALCPIRTETRHEMMRPGKDRLE